VGWNQIQNQDKSWVESRKTNQLWELLEQFLDIFPWHKGELGCYKLGEHVIDTQGFSSCKTTPSKPSFWEHVETNMQINALVLARKDEFKYIWVCLQGNFANQEGWHSPFLWRLQTLGLVNTPRCFFNVTSKRCFDLAREVSMVFCLGSTF
jgi:hypothetical protein